MFTPGSPSPLRPRKSPEFDYGPDCIADRQGLLGRPDGLLGGGKTIPHGDFRGENDTVGDGFGLIHAW